MNAQFGTSAFNGVQRQVEVSWNGVDNAGSYDIWISSLNSFEQIMLLEDVVGFTTSVPIFDLAQGANRVWARANLADNSLSAWSTGADFQVDLTVSLTGPTGITGQNLIEDTTPVITWIRFEEATSYDICVSFLGVDFGFIDQSATATNGDSGVVTTSFVSETLLAEDEYRV